MAAAASIRSGSIRRSWSDRRLKSAVSRTGVYWATRSGMAGPAGAPWPSAARGAGLRSPPQAGSPNRPAISAQLVQPTIACSRPRLADVKVVSAAFEVTLAGNVALRPPLAGVGLGFLEPLALEANESDELLVLLFRQGVRDAGDQPFDQGDPLLQGQGSRLVDQGADHGVVHPVSRLAGRHGSSERERSASVETS